MLQRSSSGGRNTGLERAVSALPKSRRCVQPKPVIAIQFCFGAAESGAWPAVTRTLSRWIPCRERGRAQGIALVGAHATAALTPLLVHELGHSLSWRAIFLVFGFAGLLWAAVWYVWFRDEPVRHPHVNAAELARILEDCNLGSGRPNASPGPSRQPPALPLWQRLLMHRNVWALCLMYLPNSFLVYFFITWFHKFLSEGRGMTGRQLAFFTGLPLPLSVAGDVLGGVLTDWAGGRFGRRWGRAGVVSATMNTAGQIAAMACPPLVICLKNHYGWNSDLLLIGGSFLLASLCWFVIDPRKKVFLD